MSALKHSDPWPAIRECEGWRFRRGRRDCCTFVAYVVKQTTGRDLLAYFPQYGTRREAEQILTDCGGWEGMLDKCLTRIPVLQASRGDVVLLGDELGICVGTAAACFTQNAGVHYRPIHGATGAWRG